jgi:hypothetical protein
MQVGMISAVISKPVNQPGIAVKIEDDGLFTVNKLSKSRSLNPCGCSRSDCSLKRSTTLMNRILRSGNSLAQQRCRRQCFLRGNIAGASHHHVRLMSLIVARLAQMLMPFVQCVIAASISDTAGASACR